MLYTDITLRQINLETLLNIWLGHKKKICFAKRETSRACVLYVANFVCFTFQLVTHLVSVAACFVLNSCNQGKRFTGPLSFQSTAVKSRSVPSFIRMSHSSC